MVHARDWMESASAPPSVCDPKMQYSKTKAANAGVEFGQAPVHAFPYPNFTLYTSTFHTHFEISASWELLEHSLDILAWCSLQVTAVTAGLGAWSSRLPVFVEDRSVIAFLQGSVLIASTALSLALTRKLASRPWLRLLPQCGITAAFAAEAWLLILGPQG